MLQNYDPIAIIGIGCRFPGGANSPSKLWQLLNQSFDGIVEIPKNRWDATRFYDQDISKPGKLCFKKGGFLKEDIFSSDAYFFNIPPREAKSIDPQQMLLLEVAWEAMEDAGILPGELKNSNTSVFIGEFALDYQMLSTTTENRYHITSHMGTGSSAAILSARLSYFFDLKGPCLSLDTACSSSLVATHLACQSLLSGESDLALAGGVNIIFNPLSSLGISQGHFLSPDGYCKTFDRDAKGYARGEGAGIVVLKKLSKALEDKDTIYAVIRGSGINQDGHTEGIFVPNSESQYLLMQSVQKLAGVTPEQIQYMEAHGTGTAVGDPLELSAIERSLNPEGSRQTTYFVGSIKSNIGHLEAAAGVAGLIKAALCLKYRKIVPNLHFIHPNPNIPFDQYKLKVPTAIEEFPHPNEKLFAGINSFGFGGTNAHVVLEEAPSGKLSEDVSETLPKDLPKKGLPILLSGRLKEALDSSTRNLINFLRAHPESDFADLSATLALHRTHHEHRLAFFADSTEDALTTLEEAGTRNLEGMKIGQCALAKRPKLAFVYTGMGAQWPAMGLELYKEEPVFRITLEHADKLIRNMAGWSLIDELKKNENESRIHETQVAQLAIFAIQVALTDLWRSYSVNPDMIVGHSIGEIAAAYAAGAITLEEGLLINFHRSRIQSTTAGKGTMLAASLSKYAAQEYLEKYPERLFIAAINSPNSMTFSGDVDIIHELAKNLEAKSIFNRILKVEVAYHSNHFDHLKEDFISSISSLNPKPPSIPLYSTALGKKEDSLRTPEYWWKNLRDPVQFSEALDEMMQSGCDLFLEVGPHPVLSSYLQEGLRSKNLQGTILASMHRKKNGLALFFESLCGLHVNGFPVDWKILFENGYRMIPLPTYPWQRENYWTETRKLKEYRTGLHDHPMLAYQPESATWITELAPYRFDYLPDHQIQGTPIVPGAFYVEAGLAIHRTHSSEPSCTLEDVEFLYPLDSASNEEYLLRFVYEPSNNRYVIEGNQPVKDDNWRLIARGKIYDKAFDSSIPLIDLQEFQSHPDIKISHQDFYKHLASIGIVYGPAFQHIKEVWIKGKQALSKIQAPQELTNQKYIIHPAILDSIFQSTLINIDEPIVLSRIDRIHLLKRPEGILWCLGMIAANNSSEAVGDAYVWNDKGELCLHLEGIHAAFLTKTSASAQMHLSQQFYRTLWTPLLHFEPDKTLDETCWLTAAQPDKLIDFFENFKLKNTQAFFTSNFEQAISKADPPHLIYFSNGTSAENITQNEFEESVLLLHYLQEFTTLLRDHSSGKATLVTYGTQGSPADDGPLSVQGSSLWGLMRTFGNEYPQISCKLIDISLEQPLDENALIEQILTHDENKEVMIKGSSIYTRKLEPLDILQKAPQEISESQAYELIIQKPGFLNSLTFIPAERKKPQGKDIEIHVQASAVNFKDVMKAMGILDSSITADTYSGETLGMEGAGVVIAVGNKVKNFKLGDLVCFHAPSSFATYITIDEGHAMLSLTQPQEASPLYIVFATVIRALDEIAHLKKGETILIHTAAGGVGLAAIQYAQHVGAHIIATAGSPEKIEYLRTLGVERVSDSRSLHFVEDIKGWTNGKGVDVVLNALKEDQLLESWSLIAPYGRFVEIGKRDIAANTGLPMKFFNNNTTFSAIDLDRIFIDNPAMARRLADKVYKGFQAGYFKPLPYRTFPPSQIVEAFEFVLHGKHIGKVMIKFEGEKFDYKDLIKNPIQTDACYLITGGFGAIGLKLALWLATKKGCRKLALLGRKGQHTVEAKLAVERMKIMGASVFAGSVDVSDYGALKKYMENAEAKLGPIKGIFHSAGIVDDALFQNQTEEKMLAVMNPKVQGSWNLHLLTKSRHLDFLILFSSISSELGNPGQANYAAANAFLDSLAQYRLSMDLPATTINLGAITDVGLAAKDPKALRHLRRMGIKDFPSRQIPGIIELILEYKLTHITVADIEWAAWAEAFPAISQTGKYQGLVLQEGSTGGISITSWTKALKQKPLEERLTEIQGKLKEVIAKVLKIKEERISSDVGLNLLGLDSLMATELQFEMEKALQINLPAAKLMGGPSLQDLAKIVDSIIFENEGET